MMVGEQLHRPSPSVHIPPWKVVVDDQNPDLFSPPHSGNDSDHYSPFYMMEATAALQRYLPSNDSDFDMIQGLDTYSCDQFRIYEFKVRRCARGRSHDWTECPYAHPGEKARRRDPRKYHYSGTACPDFRKGNCKKGDSCEFAHGVFECWLHPARYRTQPCKDGTDCKRRVCFFAHTPEQLRILLPQSPRSVISAESVDSPPVSPMPSSSLGSNSVDCMMTSFRNFQLGEVKSLPSSWKGGAGFSTGYGSPRFGSIYRPGYGGLPTTPTGLGYSELWDEPEMERVESGRDIRAKMLQKLSEENMPERVDPVADPSADVDDFGWVSELVQ
ncbi:Zinc finger CCCH domain-containing protein 20 [Linum perenne]